MFTSEVPLRTRTKFCALAVVLAIATPVAISQAPTPETPADAPAARLLPVTAAAYADYQGRVSEIMTKELASAKELEKALDTFGAPNLNQLSSGWLSYSGILASQSGEFTTAVRNASDYYGQERFLQYMQMDIGYARSLDGGEDALQNALTINSQDSSRISSAGAFVKEQSYKLQKVGWGKERVKSPTATLNALKVSARASKPVTDSVQKLFAGPDLNAMFASMAASPTSANQLWDKVSVIAVSAPGKALNAVSPVSVAKPELKLDPEFKPTANRMVTLAALHSMGIDQSNPEHVKAAMNDPVSMQCLQEAQGYLFGCVETAYTRYELAFCLARHGLRFEKDKIRSMGSCFAEIAS